MNTETVQNLPFELDSLQHAHRYQEWLRDAAWPFLGKRILEIGSGIGSLSQHLPQRERLILSDVDESFVRSLRTRFQPNKAVSVLQINEQENIVDLLADENLDTVVSFNVLEHIEDDAALLRNLITLLAQSKSPHTKRIISLVPAHPWAFSSVDKKMGHYRRYSDRMFREAYLRAGVSELNKKNYYSRYINLVGLLGWVTNSKLLGREKLGLGSVLAFEKICPAARALDKALYALARPRLGNSLLTVYTLP